MTRALQAHSFSQFAQPDTGLQYTVRRAFTHLGQPFAAGQIVSAEDFGSEHLRRYINARMIYIPHPGAHRLDPPLRYAPPTIEPGAGTGEPPAGDPSAQGGEHGGQGAEPAVNVTTRPVDQAAQAADAAALTAEIDAMGKSELCGLIDEHALKLDKRLAADTLRQQIKIALALA